MKIEYRTMIDRETGVPTISEKSTHYNDGQTEYTLKIEVSKGEKLSDDDKADAMACLEKYQR